MKCAHYNKFTTEFLSFAYFHRYCHKYFKLLKYSVPLGRYVPDTFSYTKQIESTYFLYGAIIKNKNKVRSQSVDHAIVGCLLDSVGATDNYVSIGIYKNKGG